VAIRQVAIMVVELLKVVLKVYCIGCLVGWLGGCLLAYLIYGTNQIFPYQCVTGVTLFTLFPVMFSYIVLVGLQLNFKGEKNV
jgi:hypothetical protein